jgi:hypothetical protein
MMRRRSFIQTLAGSGAGVALLQLGTAQKSLAENASKRYWRSTKGSHESKPNIRVERLTLDSIPT